MMPMCEPLLNDGTIVSDGISSEAVTTERPAMIDWWRVLADVDWLDKVEAAFHASWGEMDGEGRRARWLSIMDTVEADSNRSEVTTVGRVQVAAR